MIWTQINEAMEENINFEIKKKQKLSVILTFCCINQESVFSLLLFFFPSSAHEKKLVSHWLFWHQGQGPSSPSALRVLKLCLHKQILLSQIVYRRKKEKILTSLFHTLKKTKKSFMDPKKCAITSLLNPIAKSCSAKINKTKSRSRCFAGVLTLLPLSSGQILLKKSMTSKWKNSGRKTWSSSSKSTKKLANNKENGSWGTWLWLIFQYMNWYVIWTGCSGARWRPSQICAGSRQRWKLSQRSRHTKFQKIA